MFISSVFVSFKEHTASRTHTNASLNEKNNIINWILHSFIFATFEAGTGTHRNAHTHTGGTVANVPSNN